MGPRVGSRPSGAGMPMLSNARRVSQDETRQAVWVSLACSRASMRSSEALLSVLWLAWNPCWEGSRSWWASELAEDFKEADGPEVFNAGEFVCFGEWD
jgi:hypothetical protein